MSSPILPGALVGIIGGGPAGRSIALAARALGYRARTIGADLSRLAASHGEAHGGRRDCAPAGEAGRVADVLARCDVVTPAFEHVHPRALAAAARAGARIRPAATLIAVAQDRVLERDWLTARGVPLVPWYAAATLDQALAAFERLDGHCVLKPALRCGPATGVRRAATPAELGAAWAELGGARCAIEQAVRIDAELSVVVARAPGGAVAAFPLAESRRCDRGGAPRLLWSVLPWSGPAAFEQKARRLAVSVAERLGVEGLLAVEMFLLVDGRLVVNELVPCPHPSFAGAEQACATGQYEQLVRAICGLPLGPTTLLRPVAVAPVYGDEWSARERSRVDDALRVPGVTLHAYGVESPAPAQRAGHLAAWGDSPDEAVSRVRRAHAALTGARAEARAAAGPRVRHGAAPAPPAAARRLERNAAAALACS